MRRPVGWLMAMAGVTAASVAWGQRAPNAASDPADATAATATEMPTDNAEAIPESADASDIEEPFGTTRWTRLDLDEALEIVDLLSPTLAAELRLQRENDPDSDPRITATLLDEFPRVRDLLELKRRDRDVFDLRIRDLQTTRDLNTAVERLRSLSYDMQAEPEAMKAATVDLRKRVEEQFRVRQDMRALEVRRLRERVGDLEKRLDARWRERSIAIDERLGDLLTREGLAVPQD